MVSPPIVTRPNKLINKEKQMATFKYQVFHPKNPTKVLAIVEASSRGRAYDQAYARFGTEVVVRLPEEAAQWARSAPVAERRQASPVITSRHEHPVSLREALPLSVIQGRVILAITADVGQAHSFEVLGDGTVRYSLGDDMFARTWQVNPDDEIELGPPTQVELVAQPVSQSSESQSRNIWMVSLPIESGDSVDQKLYEVSKVINPGQSESFHRRFALGRNQSYRPGASFREAMAGISESLHPGRSARFHQEFARGRGDVDASGTHDAALRELGETLGYDGVTLEEFVRGRD
jgi:hypothetical protein